MSTIACFEAAFVLVSLIGLSTYLGIVLKLQIRGIRLPLLDRLLILCFCVAVPMTVLAFLRILFKPSLVVPIYTLATLPPLAYLAVMLLFLHGFVEGVMAWPHTKKVPLPGSYVERNMEVHIRLFDSVTYMGLAQDWSLRIRGLMLHYLIGGNLHILFAIAGGIDGFLFFLFSSNFFLCLLLTMVSAVIRRILPFVFLVSDLPTWVYAVSVFLLLSRAIVRFLLRLNRDVYTIHLQLALKEMRNASDSEKIEYILYYRDYAPPAEVLLYDFFLRDYYMSILL